MHNYHTKITRRSFLAKATANVAALSVVPSSVLGLRGAGQAGGSQVVVPFAYL